MDPSTGECNGDISINYTNYNSSANYELKILQTTISITTDVVGVVVSGVEEFLSGGTATPAVMAQDAFICLLKAMVAAGCAQVITGGLFGGKFTDKGGSVYLSCVAQHMLQRTVNAGMATIYQDPTGSPVNMTINDSMLLTVLGISGTFDSDKNASFTYRNINQQGDELTFSFGEPDVSLIYGNGGMVVTTKIDAVNAGADNYMCLTLILDSSFNLFSINGTVAYYNAAKLSNDTTCDFVAPTSGTICFVQLDASGNIITDGSTPSNTTQGVGRLNNDGTVDLLDCDTLQEGFVDSFNDALTALKNCGSGTTGLIDVSDNLWTLPSATLSIINAIMRSLDLE